MCYYVMMAQPHWSITPVANHCFRRTCCFHLEGKIGQQVPL